MHSCTAEPHPGDHSLHGRRNPPQASGGPLRKSPRTQRHGGTFRSAPSMAIGGGRGRARKTVVGKKSECDPFNVANSRKRRGSSGSTLCSWRQGGSNVQSADPVIGG